MPLTRTAAAAREALGQAARTAAAHPLRSGLGALAMAVGVATVAIVITALQGLAEFAQATTARTFGADTFVLARIASPGSIGRRELEEKLARNPILRRSDLRFLEQWAGGEVLYAPAAQRSGEATAGGRKFENAAITGTSAALADIRDLGLARGRFLSREDEARAALALRRAAVLRRRQTGVVAQQLEKRGTLHEVETPDGAVERQLDVHARLSSGAASRAGIMQAHVCFPA